MKQAANDIVVEGAIPVAQAITYLEELVHALKGGAVHVRHGDHEVVLGPHEVVDFGVIAKSRNKRHRLSLELTWRRKARDPGAELELRFAADRGNQPVAAAEAGAEAPGEQQVP